MLGFKLLSSENPFHRKDSMKNILFAFVVLTALSCNTTDNAQQIVNKTIKAHGSHLLEDAMVEFDFRDRHYTYTRKGGTYEYTREWEDSVGMVKDYLTNEGAYRTINSEKVTVEQEQMDKYANSVNSVHYFATLPYSLNDPAVNKDYLGTTSINNQSYHLLKVYFEEEGGGKDFEDIFLYWIHESDYTIDYLAYSYKTDGGGSRFRSAYNRRVIDGIVFQDYINYKPLDEKNTPLEGLAALFEKGELEELSRIETENVVVVK